MDILNITLDSSEGDSSEFDEDERTAEERLAGYHPRDKNDRTRAVLTNFLRFLPVDGKQMLAKFIASSPNDEVLYNLFRHLLTSILWPGQSTTLNMGPYGGPSGSDVISPHHSQNWNNIADYRTFALQ